MIAKIVAKRSDRLWKKLINPTGWILKLNFNVIFVANYNHFVDNLVCAFFWRQWNGIFNFFDSLMRG